MPSWKEKLLWFYRQIKKDQLWRPRQLGEPFWKVTFGLLAVECGQFQSSNTDKGGIFTTARPKDEDCKKKPFHRDLICGTTEQCDSVPKPLYKQAGQCQGPPRCVAVQSPFTASKYGSRPRIKFQCTNDKPKEAPLSYEHRWTMDINQPVFHQRSLCAL